MPSNAQIGRCGELLVQYRLLRFGIESAQMTTDAGIDLVAYAPRLPRAMTVQVKTNLKPTPAGGQGGLQLSWWLRENSPADLVALVNLDLEQVWLLRHAEMAELAQQHANGRLHLYFYTDTNVHPVLPGRRASDFDEYILANRSAEIFGIHLDNGVPLPS